MNMFSDFENQSFHHFSMNWPAFCNHLMHHTHPLNLFFDCF